MRRDQRGPYEKEGTSIRFTAKDYFELGREEIRQKYKRPEQELLLGIADEAFFYTRNDVPLSCMMEGEIDGFRFSLPFSWDFTEGESRYVAYQLSSFHYPGSLLKQYWKTADAEYRERFLDWVFDWIRVHPRVDLNDKWAWHDDATARRAIYFCMTLLLFEKVLTKRQIEELRRSLRFHARLLSRESFYNFGHNHGMYQDRALAMYALTCAEEPEYYYTLSRDRSAAYFREAFTDEGVHKEHSPVYGQTVENSIAWFALVFREIDEAYARELDSLQERMAAYITWITMPDRKVPSIGDSPRRYRTIPLWTKYPIYRWVASGGMTGKPPAALMRAFLRSGYGVIRRDWRMDGESTWMLLLAATHSEAHKHNDDLSFLLYHDGELITEAGNRNYEYADPLTEYTYSSYAHNVLFVDGEGWKMKPSHLPLLEPEAYETRIVATSDSGGVSSVTGRQVRFPGVTQERTLRYDRQKEIVTVEDALELDRDAALRLIYHTAPGVEIRETRTGKWVLSRNGAAKAVVSAAGSAPVSRSTLTKSDPPWRTEIFWGNAEPKSGGLLILDMPGKRGQNRMELTVSLL